MIWFLGNFRYFLPKTRMTVELASYSSYPVIPVIQGHISFVGISNKAEQVTLPPAYTETPPLLNKTETQKNFLQKSKTPCLLHPALQPPILRETASQPAKRYYIDGNSPQS